jgi:hypothetical protein
MHARGKCQVTTCECGGFVTADFGPVSDLVLCEVGALTVVMQVPTAATERCVCAHEWWQHQIFEPNPFSNNRGGNVQQACGGFYPVRCSLVS